MDRRRYLLGGGSLAAGVLAGCLTLGAGESDGSDLAPPDDRDVEAVATAAFDEDVSPICAEGESASGSVEGPNGEYVSAHEFFRDSASGRYGVRGRIDPGEQRGNVPSIRAEFSDGTSATDRIYGLEDDETYLFTITAAEGDPDAIDGYALTVRDGETADIGTVGDYFATIEGEWGEIGGYDGDSVYGCVATVSNEYRTELELWPRCKASIDESIVAYSGSSAESIGELEPDETTTVYFPYPRCDPGAIDEIEPWLEWSTMDNP